MLAKKTGSTDNLTGHLGTAKSTDCLIKEVRSSMMMRHRDDYQQKCPQVQFALKYFQDVVAKGAFEMLPGCATVVLETVLAIQAFAGSLSSPPEQEVVSGLQSAYKAVAALTAWADTVILGESVTGDQVEKVVEPVRCAVIVLVNCIAARVGPGGLGRGSSLPDITSDLPDDPGLSLSQSSDSILDLALQKPPLLPRISGPSEPAPPLPPKLARPRFDRSFEDLLAQSYSLQSRALDWPQGVHTPRSSQSRSRAQRLIDRTLPSPHGLDTTLPDLELVSASRESLTEIDGTSRPPHLHLSPFSWSQSSRERSNTSSPSLETLSLTSHLSEEPPAVPRKSRLSTPDPTRPFPNRKMSQYDNLPESEAHSLRRSYDTDGCPRLHMPRSDSFPLSPHTTWAKVSTKASSLSSQMSLNHASLVKRWHAQGNRDWRRRRRCRQRSGTSCRTWRCSASPSCPAGKTCCRYFRIRAPML